MKAIPLALGAVMKRIVFLLLVAAVLEPVVAQQTVTVPSKIRFANLQLRLSDKAVNIVQANVNSLMRSPTYFKRKVDQMNAHFPIIEEVFRQEKLPDEFKYLVLQESALIGDAVSSANAIGYWQFKVPAATEVGLEINRQVDERMHIYYASRGAARYLKKNNLLFNNWIYALMAYNTGPGGAMKRVDSKNFGVKKMNITHKTHWYVLKFLAHMLAFESYVDHKSSPKKLDFVTGYGGKTLKEVARKKGLDPEELAVYNRWVRSRVIPTNKDYPVVIPAQQDGSQIILADNIGISKTEDRERENVTRPASELVSVNNKYTPGYRFLLAEVSKYPEINREEEGKLLINGKEGILSRFGDNVRTLAAKGKISERKLEKYNDLDNRHAGVIPGKPYYLEKKNRRASAHYHVARPDETWWSISQRFGIRLKRLLSKNRVEKGEPLRAGRIVFLRFRRPARIPIEYQQVPENKEVVSPPVNIARKNEPERQPEEKSKQTAEELLPQQKELQQKAETNETNIPAPESESRKPVPVAKPDFPKVEDTTRIVLEVNRPGRSENQDKKNRAAPDPVTKPTANVSSPAKNTSPAQPDVVPGNAVTEKTGAKEHEVEAGETYYSISRTYGLRVNELLEMNNLTIKETLKVGQVLQVVTSTAASAKKEKVIHTVKAGETLYSLSKQYSVSLQDLLQWNNKSSYELNTGEEIIIMSGGSE
jgi:membrane-bound lytic murein transglycosylase D